MSNNGYSIGLCTSSVWKKEKSRQDFGELISKFYANELLRMKRSNQTISIRIQGQSYCKFLQTISGKGNGNVLVLCKFFENKVTAYYFVANCNNYTVSNNFINDSVVFRNIIDQIHTKIDRIVQRYKIENYSTLLFSEHVTNELFPRFEQKLVHDINQNIKFTGKQKEIILILATGCKRSKDIANMAKITIRTADWYIQELKSKLHLNTRDDLVSYAKKLLLELKLNLCMEFCVYDNINTGI